MCSRIWSSVASRCSERAMSRSVHTPRAISSSPRIAAKRAAQLVGLLHARLEAAALWIEQHAHASVAQAPLQPQRRIERACRERHQEHVAAWDGFARRRPARPAAPAPPRSRCRQGPVHPAPSRARRSGRRPARCSARRAPCRHLERRAHVVVEAAHQARAQPRTGCPSSVSWRRTSAKCSPHAAQRWSMIVGSASIAALIGAAPCSRERAAGWSRPAAGSPRTARKQPHAAPAAVARRTRAGTPGRPRS